MLGRGVEIWPRQAYKVALRQETDGLMAQTHLALLQPPEGRRCRGYVKHFSESKPRGLFNEWFSYHVLEALNVPQPRCALMQAPPWGATYLQWAFVSCEPSPVNAGTPKQIYRGASLPQLAGLTSRLLSCPQLPSLIAVDELIANGDRNLGNLVFTGESSFVAIDHSNALHGPAWTWTELWRTQHAVGSPLVRLLQMVHGSVPRASANAIVAAAQIAQERYYQVQDELRLTLKCQERSDSHVAMDMTWWRCDDLADWFKVALGVI